MKSLNSARFKNSPRPYLSEKRQYHFFKQGFHLIILMCFESYKNYSGILANHTYWGWDYVKSVRIRSFSGLHFLAFGLITDQKTDAFYAVWRFWKRPHYTLKVLRWGCQKIFKVSLVTFYIMLEKIKVDPRGLDPFLFVIRVRSHTLVRNNSTGACNMNSYIRRFILFEINGKVFPFLLF